MKDIFRNKTFYFIAVPVVLVLWPLLVAGVYLPKSEDKFEDEQSEFRKGQKLILQILEVDPSRIVERAASGKFDYASEVEQAASKYSITATQYNLSSAAAIKSSERKTQEGRVTLDKVSIVQVAEFPPSRYVTSS